MQAELLTLGWTLSFAALCYELRSLKKFISLDLHPVYFLLEGPPSHQLLSRGAKAIRQQWKRNTTVFTFNSLGLMPWTSYEICCEDGYKKHEWLTKEQRVSLSGCWDGSEQSSSPGWPHSRKFPLGHPVRHHWAAVSKPGLTQGRSSSKIAPIPGLHQEMEELWSPPLTQKLIFLCTAGLSAHWLWKKGKKTPDQCMPMN